MTAPTCTEALTTTLRPRAPRRRLLAGVAVATALVALAGCSDDGGNGDSTAPEDLVEVMVDARQPRRHIAADVDDREIRPEVEKLCGAPRGA